MTKENKASDGPLISNFNVQRNHEKLIKSAYAQESCPEILVSMSNAVPRNLHFSKHSGVFDTDNPCVILWKP